MKWGKHVSIDEFQDIDGTQYELVKRLAPGKGSLCVIGDPDQAIYGFRGTGDGAVGVPGGHPGRAAGEEQGRDGEEEAEGGA